MKKVLVSALSVFLVIGCGADELNANTTTNAKTEEVPVTPLGTVSGQVLTVTHEPLADATVRLVAGELTLSTTTNEDGDFSFLDVPAGSEIFLSFRKEGHSSAHTNTRIPAEAGFFPLAKGNAQVGPIVLVPLDTNIEFHVIDSLHRPAAGAKARVQVDLAVLSDSSSYNSIVSLAAADSVVDTDGRLTFKNMPNPFLLSQNYVGFTVWVSPFDGDGDGVADHGGASSNYSAAELATKSPAQRRIELPAISSNSGTLRLLVANVESLIDASRGSFTARPARNLIKQDESIRLVFNEDIEPASVVARLTDEEGAEEMQVDTEVSGNILTIKSVQTLSNGAEYNLLVRAVSVHSNSFNSTGFFFVGDRANPLPLAIKSVEYRETGPSTPLAQGETVYVTFNQVLSADVSEHDSVHAFFNADIDGNNAVGKDEGETGNPHGLGFPLVAAEPQAPVRTSSIEPRSVFPLAPSNYTSRFEFKYALSGVPLNTISSGTHVTVDFSLQRNRTSTVYDTSLGEPVTGSYQEQLDRLPQIIP